MGTTVNGLPFPEPTDQVSAGADAIRALAENVRVWTGTYTVPSGSANPGTVTVTLPVGFFTLEPRIILSARNPYASAGVYTASASSMTVYAMWRSGTGAIASTLGQAVHINYALFQIGDVAP